LRTPRFRFDRASAPFRTQTLLRIGVQPGHETVHRRLRGVRGQQALAHELLCNIAYGAAAVDQRREIAVDRHRQRIALELRQRGHGQLVSLEPFRTARPRGNGTSRCLVAPNETTDSTRPCRLAGEHMYGTRASETSGVANPASPTSVTTSSSV
jgi:hypothetical protein